ncbi:Exosome complex component RRP42 [Nowakowskiella sp. JEL0407]|nr:Exosome complex component RRP42 [Nowakowskiella sp. JEL0407]
MAFKIISPVELSYISEGIKLNCRADGRSRLDFRRLRLESGLISQASGSCRVSLDGGTLVLVGVKVEVGSIDANLGDDGGAVDFEDLGTGAVTGDVGGDQSNLGESSDDLYNTGNKNIGRVVCTVECSPSASRAFDNKELAETMNSYSQFLTRLLNGPQGGIDLKSLCIIPGSTCWVVYVDVLVLDFGGNLMDAISIGVCGALINTRMPKAVVEEMDGIKEFDISDEETEVIQGAERIPFCLTLSKIGSHFIVDATPLEELCTDASLLIAVNRSGNICALQKSGQHGFDPSLLSHMIQSGRQCGVDILRQLDTVLDEEKKLTGPKKDMRGFLY